MSSFIDDALLQRISSNDSLELINLKDLKRKDINEINYPILINNSYMNCCDNYKHYCRYGSDCITCKENSHSNEYACKYNKYKDLSYQKVENMNNYIKYYFPKLKYIDYNCFLIAGGFVSFFAYLSNERAKIYTCGTKHILPRDIDIFIYGISFEEAEQKIDEFIKINEFVNINQIEIIRSANAVTIKDNLEEYSIQIVLKVYETKLQVLRSFDFGSCQIGFDGKDIILTNLGKLSFEYGINIFDPFEANWVYIHRLTKYFYRGFHLVVPCLNKSKLEEVLSICPELEESKELISKEDFYIPLLLMRARFGSSNKIPVKIYMHYEFNENLNANFCGPPRIFIKKDQDFIFDDTSYVSSDETLILCHSPRYASEEMYLNMTKILSNWKFKNVVIQGLSDWKDFNNISYDYKNCIVYNFNKLFKLLTENRKSKDESMNVHQSKSFLDLLDKLDLTKQEKFFLVRKDIISFLIPYSKNEISFFERVVKHILYSYVFWFSEDKQINYSIYDEINYLVLERINKLREYISSIFNWNNKCFRLYETEKDPQKVYGKFFADNISPKMKLYHYLRQNSFSKETKLKLMKILSSQSLLKEVIISSNKYDIFEDIIEIINNYEM